RGLTGEQGVIIPARNMLNLVLNDEVVEAVRDGQFRIWPIRRVDEGWEILAGMPAGQREEGGSFPEDSVYGRAAARLWEWAIGWREFGRPIRKGRTADAMAGEGESEEAGDDKQAAKE
ncbi:MAG: hypothetical protein PVJ43_12800, partial [Gemmatimonadales bacterium]